MLVLFRTDSHFMERYVTSNSLTYEIDVIIYYFFLTFIIVFKDFV